MSHTSSPLPTMIDEIDALSSIYGDDWCAVDEDEKIFCIKISDCLEQPKWTLCLQVILPSEYPATAPPIYQLNAPWLRGQEYMELANSLEEIYVKNLGESILYLWVEKIREVLIDKSQSSDPAEPDVKKITEEIDEDDYSLEYKPVQEEAIKTLNFVISESQEDEELPPINHGNPISDRRSTFQAHLAPVVSPKQMWKPWPMGAGGAVPDNGEEATHGAVLLHLCVGASQKEDVLLLPGRKVKMVLAKLYQNKKIASATHNIYAYRIYCEDKQTYLQDCEDDGETAAGRRLLHLMQILNVRNVLVVVSRWYGGILLGPDRFKHINNCARSILVEYNYINSAEESAKHLGKNKRIRKEKKQAEH